jgi:hypothetical protein
MWSSGDAILARHVLGERVLTAIPQRVITDGVEATVAWIDPATTIAFPAGLAEDGSIRHPSTWTVDVRPWVGNGCLDLTPAGRAHMIRHSWADDGTFAGWYVNLQTPARRRRAGLDSTDHQLDLRIGPEGDVHWKDEAHLELAVGHGMFSRQEAVAVGAEAERVLEEWPFPTGWEDWRPPPEWEPPPLPEGWDVV